MQNSTFNLVDYSYKKPFFDNLDAIDDIKKIRGDKDYYNKYRLFTQTYDEDIKKFEKTLTDNLGNFMYLIDLLCEGKDKVKRNIIREKLLEYQDAEPKYFSIKKFDISTGIKWEYRCLSLKYSNKKIDE